MLNRGQALSLMLGYAAAALVVTGFRLAIRKFRNWGRDDYLVILATAALIAQATMMNLHERGAPLVDKGPKTSAIRYYLNNTFFYLQDWAARLSILYSLLRICPTSRLRKLIRIMAVFFILTFITLLCLLIGYCKQTEFTWSRRQPIAVCKLHKSVIYLQFVAGLISDVILVWVPWNILSVMTSYDKLVFRLRILFSSTLLLTVATVIQTAITLSAAGQAGTAGLIAATTETFVAILLCNLAIIITAILNLCGFRENEDRGPVSKFSSIQFGEPGSQDTDTGNTSNHRSSKLSAHHSSDGVQGQTKTILERWQTMDVDADLENFVQASLAKSAFPMQNLQVADAQSEQSRNPSSLYTTEKSP